MDFDLIIRGGTLIDGTGAARRRVDIGLSGSRVSAVGDLSRAQSKQSIDATGLIVAPGAIDIHTHYDAQIHWDPYLSNSGLSGVTTVVMSNCGFGFAPVKPDFRDRFMLMLERTEQVPYAAMKASVPWTWETFPEWMEHLSGLPKGLNVACYVPMNALMVYVMGVDAAKSRPATALERARMRQLLDQAMDAGAVGFSFSWLGPINNHTDFDGSSMPTDVMDIGEAFNLAQVLRNRRQGVIQAATDLPGLRDGRAVCADLARYGGRPVLHNFTQVTPGIDFHNDILRWLEDCRAEGLPVVSQGLVNRVWTEINLEDYKVWEVMPAFKDFSNASPAEQLKLAQSRNFRERVQSEYFAIDEYVGSEKFPDFTLIRANGVEPWASHQDKTVAQIAEAIDRPVVDTFFDILVDTQLKAIFAQLNIFGDNAEELGKVLRSGSVMAGASDGGAHTKIVSQGHWPIDAIMFLVRDNPQFSLEEMHRMLSKAPADFMRFRDRGTLEPGKAADLMIYDLNALDFPLGHYETRHDWPNGEWHLHVPVKGIRYVVVNGLITHVDGEPTGALSGLVLSPAAATSEPSPADLQPASV
jgi:N-acyl-D-aspartate/D-glutamate deacylase